MNKLKLILLGLMVLFVTSSTLLSENKDTLIHYENMIITQDIMQEEKNLPTGFSGFLIGKTLILAVLFIPFILKKYAGSLHQFKYFLLAIFYQSNYYKSFVHL